jgi:AcrR family transcriptional regulator
MNERRPYVSHLRDEQARLTQRRILDAAAELFLADGYPATTMAAIATAAGVSAQTVYNTFGTKPALLKRLHDIRLAGDDEATAIADRPELVRLRSLPDPRAFITGYVHFGRLIFDRIGPLLSVILAGAATGDAELIAPLEAVNAERLAGTMAAATHLASMHALRRGLGVERARDLMWTLNSIEVWRLLVEQRGWTPDAYEKWSTQAMIDSVLKPERAG